MKRVVVCLDVDGVRVKKGMRFENLRDIGDPVEMARAYEAAGADEIVFLDIAASHEGRRTLFEIVRRTAEQLFVPLTVGGGIRSVDDVGAALRAGADKVSINSAAVARPEIIGEASRRFGAQCIVASIDAAGGEVFVHGGRKRTGRRAEEWARECESRGAGEILLTSIDRDGSRRGYDIELTKSIASVVSIPVVASGGAGSPADIAEVLSRGAADAALVAGILHERVTTMAEIKRAVAARGVAVRSAA